MKLQRVRLSFDPAIMAGVAEIAKENGLSVTMQIANILKAEVDKTRTEKRDERRSEAS